MGEERLSRRSLIAGGVAAGAALLAPTGLGGGGPLLFASGPEIPPAKTGPEKRLAFRCVHTGHSCDAVFMHGETFDSQGLAELDHGLRDWRTGAEIEMDRDLLELLVDVRDTLELPARTAFQLISGYRSPRTNAALHQRSDGVATKSQHMLGKAVDIALPGIPLDRIREVGLSLKAGGVGYYPEDGFVHLDTARVRFW